MLCVILGLFENLDLDILLETVQTLRRSNPHLGAVSYIDNMVDLAYIHANIPLCPYARNLG